MAVSNINVLDAIDNMSAWRWMVKTYLGEIPTCSRCEAEITKRRALESFWNYRRTFCSTCGSRFNPAEGTPICSTTWRPASYIKLLILNGCNIPVAQIAGQLDKSTKATRDMIERAQLCHGTDLNLLTSAPDSSGIKRASAAEGGGFNTSIGGGIQ